MEPTIYRLDPAKNLAGTRKGIIILDVFFMIVGAAAYTSRRTYGPESDSDWIVYLVVTILFSAFVSYSIYKSTLKENEKYKVELFTDGDIVMHDGYGKTKRIARSDIKIIDLHRKYVTIYFNKREKEVLATNIKDFEKLSAHFQNEFKDFIKP